MALELCEAADDGEEDGIGERDDGRDEHRLEERPPLGDAEGAGVVREHLILELHLDPGEAEEEEEDEDQRNGEAEEEQSV